jgi:hypothetical protein
VLDQVETNSRPASPLTQNCVEKLAILGLMTLVGMVSGVTRRVSPRIALVYNFEQRIRMTNVAEILRRFIVFRGSGLRQGDLH